MSLESITTACRLELRGCPDFVIEAELPRIARDICERTNVWVADLDEITLVDGTSSYALALPENTGLVRMIALFDADDTTREVIGLDWHYNEVTQQLSVVEAGRSGDMGIIPRACLYPLTTAAIPECVHTECSMAMEYGILQRLFARPAMTWTDTAMAMYYQGMYDSALAKKRIKLTRGSRTGSLTVRPRAFV